MVHLCNDRCAWRIKEINMCIILYRKYLENLCEFIWCLMLHRCNATTCYIEYDVVSYKEVCGAVVMRCRCDFGDASEVMGSIPQLENFFFQDDLQT